MQGVQQDERMPVGDICRCMSMSALAAAYAQRPSAQYTMYATSIGLVLKGWEDQLRYMPVKKKKSKPQREPEMAGEEESGEQHPRWWEKMFQKGRSWLEEGDVKDF